MQKIRKKGELKRTYIHSIAQAKGRVILYKSCGKSIIRISGLPDLRSGQYLSSLRLGPVLIQKLLWGPHIFFQKEPFAGL